MHCVQVTADKNIGHFLFEHHGRDEGKQLQFAKVPCQICSDYINRIFTDLSLAEAMADIFSVPEIAKHIPAGLGPVLKTVPVTKRSSVFLHPWHLDLSEKAKYGETGKYPAMCQVKAHLPSVVWRGYQQEREALEIKFDMAPSSEIGYFQVKYIDGHCKGIMCQAILGLVVFMVQHAAGWNSNIFTEYYALSIVRLSFLFQHVSTWPQTNWRWVNDRWLTSWGPHQSTWNWEGWGVLPHDCVAQIFAGQLHSVLSPWSTLRDLVYCS